MDLADAQAEFSAAEVYLDSATLGLPPGRTVEALSVALDDWRLGIVDARSFDDSVQVARDLFAGFVGVPASWVAVGHQASPFVGLVAASVPDGAEVLVAAGEFTSVTFPFLAQAGRGVTVREVPLTALAEEVRESTYLVAVAAVQSADGRLADLDALVESCARTGTRTLVDLTQAAGWLPVDATRFDWTVTSAYKWLLAPRGTAFLTARPERWDEVVPHSAGWYAGDERWSSIYGLAVAPRARRAAVRRLPGLARLGRHRASLELLTLGRRDGPARRTPSGLPTASAPASGWHPSDSAIVSLTADAEVPRPGRVGPALRRAGRTAAARLPRAQRRDRGRRRGRGAARPRVLTRSGAEQRLGRHAGQQGGHRDLVEVAAARRGVQQAERRVHHRVPPVGVQVGAHLAQVVTHSSTYARCRGGPAPAPRWAARTSHGPGPR